MPRLTFVPQGIAVDVDPGTKILVAARRASAPIRFGCGAGICGQCGVAVAPADSCRPRREGETRLLARMGLPLDGSVRLACQTYVESEDVTVDLAFQQTYDPSRDTSEA